MTITQIELNAILDRETGGERQTRWASVLRSMKRVSCLIVEPLRAHLGISK
jgi:hypothetical protein